MKIAFIGGGNMTSCIFDAILKSNEPSEIYVSGPHIEKLQKFKEKGAFISTNNKEVAQNADFIFLGVKPQILTNVLEELREINLENKILISMAAGFRVSSIQKICNAKNIVRIMPNTPSKLGEGVTGIFFNQNITEETKEKILSLLQYMGKIISLDSEEKINVIGAVAGSSPAFLYRFLDSLINETIRLGFNKEEARQIIEQMALGTSLMIINNQDMSLTELREAVTSKGGTTFQGLCQMDKYQFEQMMHDTIDACMDKTHKFEEQF